MTLRKALRCTALAATAATLSFHAAAIGTTDIDNPEFADKDDVTPAKAGQANSVPARYLLPTLVNTPTLGIGDLHRITIRCPAQSNPRFRMVGGGMFPVDVDESALIVLQGSEIIRSNPAVAIYDKMSFKVARMPTLAEIQDISSGKSVPKRSFSLKFWGVCIPWDGTHSP